MTVYCPFGLGNRVAAMANGLSRSPAISFRWVVNSHCPIPAADLFPDGVPGVTFLPAPTQPEFATRFSRMMAHCWDAAGDREAANAAYRTIMGSMVEIPQADPPELAILGRFHRNPNGDPLALAEAAMRQPIPATGRRVFVLSDCHRGAIAERLRRGGFTPVQATCRPLADDLQRSRADVLDYASDWLTVLSARRVIALDGPASALHPARAAGIRIIYVSAPRQLPAPVSTWSAG